MVFISFIMAFIRKKIIVVLFVHAQFVEIIFFCTSGVIFIMCFHLTLWSDYKTQWATDLL